MPRNKNGFLKATALINGLADQYAVIIGGVEHQVSIVHDPNRGGFVTTHKVIPPSGLIEVREWQVAKNLPKARELFSGVVRSLRRAS